MYALNKYSIARLSGSTPHGPPAARPFQRAEFGFSHAVPIAAERVCICPPVPDADAVAPLQRRPRCPLWPPCACVAPAVVRCAASRLPRDPAKYVHGSHHAHANRKSSHLRRCFPLLTSKFTPWSIHPRVQETTRLSTSPAHPYPVPAVHSPPSTPHRPLPCSARFCAAHLQSPCATAPPLCQSHAARPRILYARSRHPWCAPIRCRHSDRIAASPAPFFHHEQITAPSMLPCRAIRHHLLCWNPRRVKRPPV